MEDAPFCATRWPRLLTAAARRCAAPLPTLQPFAQATWKNAETATWDQQVDRFFAALQALDNYLASSEPMGCAPTQLFQAPIADALTHVGQLAMLRRLAGMPMRGENYFKADIVVGRVGAEQSAPRQEFD